MYLKQKIPRSSFLSFFDDFRYAGATIVALCSQGLRRVFWVSIQLSKQHDIAKPFFDFCFLPDIDQNFSVFTKKKSKIIREKSEIEKTALP